MKVDGVLREKLLEAHIWHLATASADRRPHVSAVWADVRGEHILVNSALGRTKPRNIEQNPMVALSWYDPTNEHHSFAIQGLVVETILGEQAEADIDFLANKYLDQPRYPWRAEGERRVTFLIEPSRVYRQQG
ncbi:MAG TPA: pyridoxamine 5'-phosphate oxidase family protein [Solirubrobacteraceae bacterium]|nr:pyridoxamine 5'-phosphate oxidase family protein [Solirubrobacteraceae bacterium]